MSDLRNKLIKLAHEKPELRVHLLPLLKEESTTNKSASWDDSDEDFEMELMDVEILLEMMTDNGFSPRSLLKDFKENEADFREDLKTFADDLGNGKEIVYELRTLNSRDLERKIKALR